MTSPNRLRETFDQVALDYDEARPSYPRELIDDIIQLSNLPDDGRILEVGCGTGIATRLFAERGYPMLSIDIGSQMLAVANRNLAHFAGVETRLSAFEDLPADVGLFNLMIAATAFHWIDPAEGYPRVARFLKPGGSMAIFIHHHPGPVTGYFDEVQSVYRRVVPEWDDPREGPPIDEIIAERAAAIENTDAFQPVTVKRYSWSRDYTTEQYLKLLNTYSGHIALPDDRRAELFKGCGDLLDTRYGGVVSRPYLTVLYHARVK